MENRKDKDKALLLGPEGHRLANSTLNYILKGLARQCGVKKVIHPHTLRKSRGQHILDETENLHLAQKKLRHAQIQTTQQSYADFSPEKVEELLEGKLLKLEKSL